MARLGFVWQFTLPATVLWLVGCGGCSGNVVVTGKVQKSDGTTLERDPDLPPAGGGHEVWLAPGHNAELSGGYAARIQPDGTFRIAGRSGLVKGTDGVIPGSYTLFVVDRERENYDLPAGEPPPVLGKVQIEVPSGRQTHDVGTITLRQ